MKYIIAGVKWGEKKKKKRRGKKRKSAVVLYRVGSLGFVGSVAVLSIPSNMSNMSCPHMYSRAAERLLLAVADGIHPRKQSYR